MSTTPKCDMVEGCKAPISHIDHKGFAYCEEPGKQRQSYIKCRKLRPHELKKLLNGEQLKRY